MMKLLMVLPSKDRHGFGPSPEGTHHLCQPLHAAGRGPPDFRPTTPSVAAAVVVEVRAGVQHAAGRIGRVPDAAVEAPVVAAIPVAVPVRVVAVEGRLVGERTVH